MGHPYRIREIALQADLSEATVDRVLNNRGGVRASTVAEVHQAIEDLYRQRSQLQLNGRTFLVDVVVDAPPWFSASVRAALETEQRTLRPARIRARYHFRDGASADEIALILDRISRRSSQGVILKARDVPDIAGAVQRLVLRDIPVVTLVTDLPATSRQAYVGIDNRAAGATAAYLLDEWLGTRRGDVMVVRSGAAFRGEDEREMGFRATLREARPRRQQIDVIDADGRNESLYQHVRTALAANPGIRAVYSMYSVGGGSAAVARAFDDARRPCVAAVAHDLNSENVELLRHGRLSAVLHHDLNHDLRHACQVIMQARHALPGAPRSWPSAIQIITPHNLPLANSG